MPRVLRESTISDQRFIEPANTCLEPTISPGSKPSRPGEKGIGQRAAALAATLLLAAGCARVEAGTPVAGGDKQLAAPAGVDNPWKDAVCQMVTGPELFAKLTGTVTITQIANMPPCQADKTPLELGKGFDPSLTDEARNAYILSAGRFQMSGMTATLTLVEDSNVQNPNFPNNPNVFSNKLLIEFNKAANSTTSARTEPSFSRTNSDEIYSGGALAWSDIGGYSRMVGAISTKYGASVWLRIEANAGSNPLPLGDIEVLPQTLWDTFPVLTPG